MRPYATDSGQVNLRVAGVCINDGHVLLHHDDGVEDFWVLPGGRPLLFESSADALQREMDEEIGVAALADLPETPRHFIHWDA